MTELWSCVGLGIEKLTFEALSLRQSESGDYVLCVVLCSGSWS